jgi:multiple sugar transport system ATP-binding protein
MAKLVLQNLTKDFGKIRAVNNLSLEVADGEFIVILGPSGAGKTTTLKLIAGVEMPTSGKIYIGDRLMNAVEPYKRNVAMAFESYALYPQYTVGQNLAFPLKAPVRKLPQAEIDRRVKAVAEQLNIQSLLDRLPRMLSGGQRQRVALGRALVREPEVLLLDEPISHLDAKLRHRMRSEFKALSAEIRATTVYVTHDYLEALSLGDRLAVLQKGEIQQIGKPHEVFANPINTFVAKILGHPQINLIESTVQRDGDQLQLASHDSSICVEVPARLRDPLLKANLNTVTLGIRPLHMQVMNGTSSNANLFTGTVYVYERLGTKGVLTATVGQQKIDILTPIEMNFKIDETLKVAVESDQIMIFDSNTQKNILFA